MRTLSFPDSKDPTISHYKGSTDRLKSDPVAHWKKQIKFSFIALVHTEHNVCGLIYDTSFRYIAYANRFAMRVVKKRAKNSNWFKFITAKRVTLKFLRE